MNGTFSDHKKLVYTLEAGNPGIAVVPRHSNACVHCKSQKVRCDYDENVNSCRRCLNGNLACVPRGRKKRKPAPTQDELQRTLDEKNLQIVNLQLRVQMQTEKNTRDWVARCSSHNHSEDNFSNRIAGHQVQSPGVGDLGGMISYIDGMDECPIPFIVKHCGLSRVDIAELFNIFFDRVNPYFSILDPELHTSSRLGWASPFLFTVICAISARYYTAKPKLYLMAQSCVNHAARQAIFDGVKRIDVCQAFLLMAVYPVPKKSWEDDRSWLFMGVAIRMAIELGLDQPPPPGCEEGEGLSRIRTWLNCYCVDGSHATQFGKIPMLRLDDYLARHSKAWYKSSFLNLPFDIHLCAYVDILQLMAEFRSAAGVLNSRVTSAPPNFIDIAIEFDARFTDLTHFWLEQFENDPRNTEPICVYRKNTVRLITAYSRLVVLSWGFQHAKQRLSRDSPIVMKSTEAARSAIGIIIKDLYPTKYLRYALNANFLYVAFAAGFLIQLLRPKLYPLLDDGDHKVNINFVQRLIEVLASKDVALDGRHTPALYSRFLSSLLARHQPAAPQANPAADTWNFAPHHDQQQQRPSVHYSWPDMPLTQEHDLCDSDTAVGMMDQYLCGIDLSLQHFVQAVSSHDQDLLLRIDSADCYDAPGKLQDGLGNQYLGDGQYYWPSFHSRSE